MTNARTYSLLIVILVTAVSCGKPDNKAQSNANNANTASSGPSPNAQAVEIGNLLKAKGIPLIQEVTNSTNSLKGIVSDKAIADSGIISEAVTWTEAADIDITVFQTENHRKEARARMDKVPGPVYYAECGVIQIIFHPEKMKPNKEAERQAAKTLEILKATYGCK